MLPSQVMFEIKSVEITSDIATRLHSLLKKEWVDLDVFEAQKYGTRVPDPLVALQNGVLVGGLSFTAYEEPNSDIICIWINTVFVDHACRKQGIGTQLIQASYDYAACLYALTDIPALYTKIGWEKVKADKNGTIVKYAEN